MKVLIGSDYHCKPSLLKQALALIPEVDWYINCGDFCSQAGAQPKRHRTLGYSLKGFREVELLRQFLADIDQLGKPWVFLPGNHDPSTVALAPLAGRYGTVITEPRLFQHQDLQILAIPYTPPCGWNWSLTTAELSAIQATYAEAQVDIIITHAPPKGILDEGGKWYHRNTPTLRPVVEALHPHYYFCGHMHLDGGKIVTENSTTFVNAALHNLVLEIPDRAGLVSCQDATSTA